MYLQQHIKEKWKRIASKVLITLSYHIKKKNYLAASGLSCGMQDLVP